MPGLADGTVWQSGGHHNPADYEHLRMFYPVLGIVLNVYVSDDRVNRDAARRSDQRGSRPEAQVLVINDGRDTPWIVPNALICPPGSSGVDNFHEELPRACSQMVDGSTFDQTFAGVDVEKLDGDWCIVQFLGGNIDQPIVTSWFPHPGNVTDPATGGFAGNKVLAQGRRFFKRFQGAKLTITNTGSVYLDTTESGFPFKGGSSGATRTAQDDGGDIQVDVKNARRLEVNFNPPVQPYTDPSLPQANPPKQDKANDRTDTDTRFTLTKDEVHLIAGKVVEILARTDMLTIQAKKALGITSTDDAMTLKSKKELHAESTDDAVTFKAKGNITADGKEIHLNGEALKWLKELLVADVQDLVKVTLTTILNAGTAGGPTKQQIVLASNIQQAKLATTPADNYKLANVKAGT